MEDIRYLAERCRDILLYRIELVLEEMTKVQLYDLPTDEPVAPEEFLQMIERSSRNGAQTLAKYGPLFFSCCGNFIVLANSALCIR